jgi:LysM repeat protein
MTTSYQPAASTAYVVKPGDTLSAIAARSGIAQSALALANGLKNANLLRAGSILRLPSSSSSTGNATAPAPGSTSESASATTTVLSSGAYRVKPGDTLWAIALSLGLTPDELAQSNGLNIQMPIKVGQLLHYAVVLYNGPSRAEIGAVLDQQSAQVGVENALLKAIAWRESSWRMVDAADGGIGVMQLMPYTVDWLKSTYVPGAWDPHNLVDNIHAGATLLLVYSHLYGGDLTKVAEAYHGGMGVVGKTPTAEMEHYISTVAAFRLSFLSGMLPQ